MKKQQPLVSVIIVTYNGKRWLKTCLDSVQQQRYPNLEVILVDNASTDTSIRFVKKNYPKVIVVRANENLGFAEGNNLGVAAASGEVLFLLNNDTNLLETDLIQKTIAFMSKNKKIAVVQPKICFMDYPNKIDLCGSFWTNTTMLYHYGCFQDESDPQFSKNFPVFTCKGAALFVTKMILEKVGLFDADFWCYYEETDFCHRVWLAGFECWYFSDAKLLHANGGTSLGFENDFIQYHNTKNKLRSFIKNFRGFERISVITKFTIASVIFLCISLYHRKTKNIKAVYSGYVWNIQKLLSLKGTQEVAIVGTIPQSVIKSPGPRYYIDLIRDLKKHHYSEEI